LSSIIPDPGIFQFALISFGILPVVGINLINNGKEKGEKKAKGPLLLLHLDKERQPSSGDPVPPDLPEENAAVSLEPEAPAFETLQKRPWFLVDLIRALLIVLCLIVAAGCMLILLPQPTIDKLAQQLRARHGVSEPEKIAFLYLGDELKDNVFQIRGVVRNISAAPIEQLDAAIRLYAHDGSILETTVVRMNKETIDPDGIAQFELVYPNYNMAFGSYSVEFKLRQGVIVPYKDMRATAAPLNFRQKQRALGE
jgi:hypothetical protein